MIELCIAWFVCGLMGYGMTVGHSASKWPDFFSNFDRLLGGVLVFAGPLFLLAALVMCDRPYRWKL
jgi:hypothetical protein